MTRINKYLAEHGYCSRREADRLVQAGKVFINDRPAKLGDQVTAEDRVRVHGRAKAQKPELLYILINKPVGTITTTDPRRPDNVLSLIDAPARVFPVGRLDVASSGALLLTNDGTLANRLMHPRYEHEKEYVVTTDRPLSKIDIGRLKNGVMLDDGITLPAKVRQLSNGRFAIVLREGRNRQIRRMCEALGYDVTALLRTRIANIEMKNMPPGSARYLTEHELRDLKKLVNLTPRKGGKR